MARPATGSVRWDPTRAAWVVRVTMADGTRSKPIAMTGLPPCEVVPTNPPKECECRPCQSAESAGQDVSRRMRSGAHVDSSTSLTLNEFTKRWLDERERRGLASVNDSRIRLTRYVLESLGTKPIADITRADLKALVHRLDERVRASSRGELADGRRIRFSWKTAVHTWGDVTKLFSDAVDSKDPTLCILKENPAIGVRGPDKGKNRIKQYLWPAEALALMSCADVPLAFRRFYAVSTYLYGRPEEIEALEWSDVDLDHGLVTIHRAIERARHRGKMKGETKETKTDGSMRTVPIDPNLLPLLETMHDEAGGEGRLFPKPPTEDKLARALRRYLQLAGVDRPALFINDSTRQWINWYHATRATGLTWEAVRGTDPLKIMQRGGHRHFSTTQIYVREAENLRGRTGDAFPPLPPELFRSGFGISVGKSRFPGQKWLRLQDSKVGGSERAASTETAQNAEKLGESAPSLPEAQSTVLVAESTPIPEKIDPDLEIQDAIIGTVRSNVVPFRRRS